MKRLLAVVVFTTACATAAPAPEPSAEADAPNANAYETLLRRLDVAPLASLDTSAPTWLVEAVLQPSRADVLQGFEDYWKKDVKAEWESRLTPPGQVINVALIALIACERDRGGGQALEMPCKRALVRGFGLFAKFRTIEPDEVGGQALAALGWRAQLDEQRSAEFTAFFSGLVETSSTRLRIALLDLLRSDPSSPEAKEGLLYAAADADALGDYTMATDLYREAVNRTSPSATADELVSAAKSCYRVPDVACGNAYAQQARALGIEEPTDKRLTRMAELSEQLTAVPLDTWDARLARANLDVELDREADATVIFRKLAEERPSDSRPNYGLARLAMTHLNCRRAFALTHAAGPEFRSADFYNVALASWFVGAPMALRTGDTSGFATHYLGNLEYVRQLMNDYEPLNGAQVAWLRIVLDLALVLLNGTEEQKLDALTLARKKSAEALTKYPGDLELAKLRAGLSTFDPDPKSAKASLDAVLKQGSADALAMRRTVLLARGSARNDKAALTQLGRELDALENPTREEKSLRADVHALIGKDWKAIEAEYKGLDDPEGGREEEGRRMNNRGVAFAHLGEREMAMACWLAYASIGLETPAPDVNFYAIANPENRAKMRADAEAAVNATDNPVLGGIITAWDIAYGAKSPAEAKRQLRELDKRAPWASTFTSKERLPGAVITKSLQLGVNYSSERGLETLFNVKGQTWLTLEPER